MENMKIGIVGAGKVGGTIATLLESCKFCKSVALADARANIDLTGLKKSKFVQVDVKEAASLAAFVKGVDAIVSAAPYFLNKTIASACAKAGVSYFDLTEDVEVTKSVRRIARGASKAFVPQCGLAPGFISIAANELTKHFDELRSIKLRVGALPQHPNNVLKYSLTWSTEGLINEYGNPCQSVIDGKVVDAAPKQIPAPEAVKRALDLLKGAKKPLIILGKGAAYAQADADIKALVEKTGIPYLPMSMAKGLLPDTHALCASAARSFVLPGADVVMLIGARLNWLLSHGKGKTWGGKGHKDWGGQKFIQIDISPQ